MQNSTDWLDLSSTELKFNIKLQNSVKIRRICFVLALLVPIIIAACLVAFLNSVNVIALGVFVVIWSGFILITFTQTNDATRYFELSESGILTTADFEKYQITDASYWCVFGCYLHGRIKNDNKKSTLIYRQFIFSDMLTLQDLSRLRRTISRIRATS